MWGCSEKAAVCKPVSELSLGTASASALILHFPASRTVRNSFLLLKLPSIWCFVIATPVDEGRIASPLFLQAQVKSGARWYCYSQSTTKFLIGFHNPAHNFINSHSQLPSRSVHWFPARTFSKIHVVPKQRFLSRDCLIFGLSNF